MSSKPLAAVEIGTRSNSYFPIYCGVSERGLSFLEMGFNPSKVAPEVDPSQAKQDQSHARVAEASRAWARLRCGGNLPALRRLKLELLLVSSQEQEPKMSWASGQRPEPLGETEQESHSC